MKKVCLLIALAALLNSGCATYMGYHPVRQEKILIKKQVISRSVERIEILRGKLDKSILETEVCGVYCLKYKCTLEERKIIAKTYLDYNLAVKCFFDVFIGLGSMGGFLIVGELQRSFPHEKSSSGYAVIPPNPLLRIYYASLVSINPFQCSPACNGDELIRNAGAVFDRADYSVESYMVENKVEEHMFSYTNLPLSGAECRIVVPELDGLPESGSKAISDDSGIIRIDLGYLRHRVLLGEKKGINIKAEVVSGKLRADKLIFVAASALLDTVEQLPAGLDSASIARKTPYEACLEVSDFINRAGSATESRLRKLSSEFDRKGCELFCNDAAAAVELLSCSETLKYFKDLSAKCAKTIENIESSDVLRRSDVGAEAGKLQARIKLLENKASALCHYIKSVAATVRECIELDETIRMSEGDSGKAGDVIRRKHKDMLEYLLKTNKDVTGQKGSSI